nr:MAG TPA: hypothetical protein [Caudoviricetes sp.]
MQTFALNSDTETEDSLKFFLPILLFLHIKTKISTFG